jgi:Fe-S cluster assembly protein SufD
MQTDKTTWQAQLLADFQASEARLNGKSKLPFHQRRREALQAFERLGFPTIRHEEWKYSNVKNLLGQAFDFAAPGRVTDEDLAELEIPNLEGNVLYFVNGVYQPERSTLVSPAGQLQLLSWAEANEQMPELVEQHFAKYAEYDQSAFTAMNTAFAQHGIVIHVPEKAVVDVPVILRFIIDTRQGNVATQPRNLFVVGRRAEVKVAESFRTIGDGAAFTNAVTEVILGEEAHFEYYKVQNESDRAAHIGTTQIEQAARSYSYCMTISLNGGFIRNNLNIRLNGQHCEANLFGLYLPNERQHVDNHTVVDHAMPNSLSNELYKGILKDQSTGVFNGKIFVRPDAQKTNAFQSCRNILASDAATMNTKPQLEIWADDVKCSHGTTTGQLDDEALFYLRSRGVPKDAARALLMRAFAEDVVEKMRIPAIREYLEARIAVKIEE